MSLRYEMGIGVPTTYGSTLPEKPRDSQTREKPSVEKPVLKEKVNAQNH